MKQANNYLNRVVKSIKAFSLSLVACVVLIFLTPQICSAYDNDTHFWLTYYLAIKAGYTNTQATQIASANVGVDFDKDTEPLTPRFDSGWDFFYILSQYQNMRDQFHALPLTANIRDNEWWNPIKLKLSSELTDAKEIVDERKKELWKVTLDERENPGVFLHYLQDTFSHEGFTSYVGHAGYYYVDFLDSDRKKAEQMAFETLKYLIVFREALLTEKKAENLPNPERLNIEDLFSHVELLQIKKSVEEFCKVNPSLEAIYPNDLVSHWNNLDEEDKRAYRLPPNLFGFIRSIIRIKKNGPVPDSSKARKVVQELLNINESELPNIWLYDFNSNGKVPEGYKAKQALVYVPYKSKKCVFTSRDEEKNTKKREIKVVSKRQCLSFNLEVRHSQTDPFNCQ